MKKLFIIPILITFAFSQLQSKQASYIIYTDGKVYNNVVLSSNKGTMVADKVDYNFETELYDITMFDDKPVKIKLIKWVVQKNLES